MTSRCPDSKNHISGIILIMSLNFRLKRWKNLMLLAGKVRIFPVKRPYQASAGGLEIENILLDEVYIEKNNCFN
jgi:hypothetical protein